jgi:hypothetical protein
LLTSPAPPAVVEQNLQQLIADHGRRWAPPPGMDLVRAASGRIQRSPGPAHERPADRVVEPNLADVFPGIDPLLCAMFPERVFEVLRRIVQETIYQPGPAMATRPARLAEIEKERETLREQHAALVDEAEAAGVHLEHLQEEKFARFHKSQRRRMWESDLNLNRDYYERVPSARPPEPQ